MGRRHLQSDADWVRVLNDKGLLSGGKIRGGTLQADGRVTVGEYLDIESTAVEGQACPKIGIQSKNNLGAPLTCQCLTPSCQSGVWRGGATGSFKGSYMYGTFGGACWRANPVSGSCSCPPGSTAYLSGQAFQWSQWDSTIVGCYTIN